MHIEIRPNDEGLGNQQQRRRQLGQRVWFSHLEKEYQIIDLDFKKIFRWKEDQPPKMWDWDNCTVSRARILGKGKVRIVIRSKTNRHSDYMGHIPVQLRYMLGIDISSVSEPYTEDYQIDVSSRRNLPPSAKGKTHKRWAFEMDERYWIWQWVEDGIDITSSEVFRLYQDIQSFLEASNPQVLMSRQSSLTDSEQGNIIGGTTNIFNAIIDEKLDDFVPVIYQPAVDSFKNFVREVHCAKVTNPDSTVDLEVSLLFNNEELRRHKVLDSVYEKIRLLVYGRTLDVETFRIHLTYFDKNGPAGGKNNRNQISDKYADKYEENAKVKNSNIHDYFVFERIYSGRYDIEHDTIHLDTPPPPAPKRLVEYYLLDYYHPIVFINTANHAMSEHDNNHDLWKWEYIPWLRKAPIVLGKKSRKDIDLLFIPLIKRIMQKILRLI